MSLSTHNKHLRYARIQYCERELRSYRLGTEYIYHCLQQYFCVGEAIITRALNWEKLYVDYDFWDLDAAWCREVAKKAVSKAKPKRQRPDFQTQLNLQ